MSECTSIHLRNKVVESQKYRECPRHSDKEGKTKEGIQKQIEEVEEYNREVRKSLGCEMFYLSTTPSRQLNVLPWSSDPKPLTEELLAEVLYFYDDEINTCKKFIAKYWEKLAKLEERIVKANVELYDKINEEIDDYTLSIKDYEESLDDWQYWRNKFGFLKDMMENDNNAEHYELIYTKC